MGCGNSSNKEVIETNIIAQTDKNPYSKESEIPNQNPNNINITEPKPVTKIDVKPKIIDRDLSLEEQVIEWKSLIETLTSNSELMSYALAKERTEFKLVKDVGDYLAACREAQNNTEKAWLIYVWITHNIEYDEESFQNGDIRSWQPQDVLSTGLAVCTGYAELYKALCKHLRVKCFTINGYSKGESYKINQKIDHTWNAILSDGKISFIESTWAAGHLDENKMFIKEFQPYYFAVPGHIFNETHYSESYTPTDGTDKFTLEEFEKLPNNKLGYHILGLSSVNNTVQAINRTNKNPFVLEYTSPQRVYFLVSLIDDENKNEIENAGIVQSEYSKDQKSKYCLIVDIPNKQRTYKLQLLAKNERYFEDEENTFPIITEFFVIREGDEENLIPRYNLTFDYDLRLTSHVSSYIKFKGNRLAIKFEAPNNGRKIYFLTKLIDAIDNRELKCAVECKYSITEDHKSRYCFTVEMPENISKGKNYILKLFDKSKCNNKYKNLFLTKFILIRECDKESSKPANKVICIPESDQESSIPENNMSSIRDSDEDSNISQYLPFAHDIKLKSHNCNVIEFKTNPYIMEFQVPKHIKTLFRLTSKNDKIIANAVFSQINPENSDTIVQVAIPRNRESEQFRFQIFAKDRRDKSNDFAYVEQLFLTRTESDENDALKFCKVNQRGRDCFIYSPIEYSLTSNSLYEFRYFIKDALNVAIVDSSNKWIYMNELSENQHIWALETALKAKGIANVRAKFDEKTDYEYICYYEVK